MSTQTNPAVRKPIMDIRSPLIQAVSCIPCVGTVFSLFAGAGLNVLMVRAKTANDVSEIIDITQLRQKYHKIDVARNLLSVALVVGAIVLGILSGPAGAILASAHLFFELTKVCLIRDDQETQSPLNL